MRCEFVLAPGAREEPSFIGVFFDFDNKRAL
jgi:hypothetical protein